MIDFDEVAFKLAKAEADNKVLQYELERTRKALDVAVDALDTVRQYYRGTAVVRPHNIAAYCDNKIDKIKEITALEQKE